MVFGINIASLSASNCAESAGDEPYVMFPVYVDHVAEVCSLVANGRLLEEVSDEAMNQALKRKAQLFSDHYTVKETELAVTQLS